MARKSHSSFVIRPPRRSAAKAGHSKRAAFTLAEILAALAFLAILIPVVVECLHIAARAGEVAERKGAAARVAETIMNENIVTTNWQQSDQSGTVADGPQQYNWTFQNDAWNQDPFRQLTVEVKYQVQGRDYSVKLSTIVDGSLSLTNS